MGEDKEPKGDYVKVVKYQKRQDSKVSRFVVNPVRKFYYAATDQEDPRKARVSA